MNRKLKIFGLAALVMALVAGAAWAALEGVTLSGTETKDFALDKSHTIVAGIADNVFNSFAGNGKLTGNVRTDVTANDGAGAASASDLVLSLSAAKDNTVEVAPDLGKDLAQMNVAVYSKPTAVQNPLQAGAPKLLQVIVNGAIDQADNSANGNNGTVLIRYN